MLRDRLASLAQDGKKLAAFAFLAALVVGFLRPLLHGEVPKDGGWTLIDTALVALVALVPSFAFRAAKGSALMATAALERIRTGRTAKRSEGELSLARTEGALTLDARGELADG